MDQDIVMRILLKVGGFEQLQKTQGAMDATRQASQKMADSLNKTGSSADKNAGFFSKLNDKLSATQAKYGAIITAGFQMQLMGNELNRVGQKGIDILQGSLDSWGDYEFMLNRAAGSLGVWNKASTTSQVGTDLLNDAVHKAAQELRIFPAQEVAQAVYFWGSATGETVTTQKDLQRVMSAVNPIMKAAAVTQTGYETAIKGVYSILVQYHKPTSQAADVTNKLMLAAQKTALEFPDLINAFKFVGPMASAMKVPFEDVVMILGRLGDAGIRGTMAGRALSMTFTRLVKPTEVGKEALDKLFKSTKSIGKGFDEVIFPKGKFIGMKGLLDNLSKATENLTDKEKFNALAKAATQNELRILIPLIDQQTKLRHKSADAIDEEKYKTEGAADSAKKMFDLLATSWKGTLGGLQRVFETISQLVGEKLAKMLTPIINGIGDLARKFEELIRNNPQIAELVITITAFASIAAVVLGTLMALGGAFLVLSVTLGQFAPLVGALVGVSLPVVAVIAAIAAGVFLLYKAWTENWGGIQQVVGDAIAKVSAALSTVIGWVKKGVDMFLSLINGGTALSSCLSGLPEPISAIVTWLAQLWLAVQSGVQQVMPTLVDIFNTAVDLFVNHVIPAVQAIVAAFMQFWNFIQPVLIQMGAIIVDVIINKVIPALVAFAQAVGGYIIEILTQLGPVIDSVVALFTGLINFIFNDLAPVWDWLIKNVFMPFFTFLVNLFADRLKAILDIVQGVFEVIKGVITVVLGLIKGIIDTVLALVKGDWQGAWTAIQKMAETVWNGIKAIIHGAATIIQGVIEFLLTKITDIIGGGLNAAKNLFTGAMGAIVGIIKGAFGAITGAGSGLIKALWSGISSVVSWLAGMVGGLVGNIVGWFGNKLPSSLYNIGRSVIEGLWNGLKSLAGWIQSKVINLVKDILPGPIKDILGIHSPSRVMMGLGKMVMLGLALGITDNSGEVLGAVDKVTGAVVARAQTGSTAMGDAITGLKADASFSLNSKNDRTVTLKVEVTSPDGSVSRLTADQIAGLLKGTDLVEAVEYAASLD